MLKSALRAASLLAACSSVTPPGVTPGAAGTPPAGAAAGNTPAAAATPATQAAAPTQAIADRQPATGRKTIIEVYTASSAAPYQTVLELAREAQMTGDVLEANRVLKDAYDTDVRPLLARARAEAGLPEDPYRAYLTSGEQRRREETRVGGVEAGWQ